MSFKSFSFFQLWSQNFFSNFGMRPVKEHFCEIMMSFKGVSIFSSGGHFV